MGPAMLPIHSKENKVTFSKKEKDRKTYKNMLKGILTLEGIRAFEKIHMPTTQILMD